MIHSRMSWVPIRIANTPASSPDRVCVTCSTRRLSIRSANSPPAGPNSSIGANLAAVVSPSWVPLWVRSRTRNDCATVCIQVPITEMSCPMKNSR
jgi:hypothetical protein